MARDPSEVVPSSMGLLQRKTQSGSVLEACRGGYLGPPVPGTDTGGGFGSPSGL